MDVLRGEWGWDGFVVSDCGAIADINVGHHYVGNMSVAAAAGILAGTDVNCGSVYSGNIVQAVGEGLMALEDVAAAGRRFLNVVFGTGLFDPPERVPYNSYDPEKVDSLANRRLAFEAAVQGIALLANSPTSTPWARGCRCCRGAPRRCAERPWTWPARTPTARRCSPSTSARTRSWRTRACSPRCSGAARPRASP
jgi:beta-glucosidase